MFVLAFHGLILISLQSSSVAGEIVNASNVPGLRVGFLGDLLALVDSCVAHAGMYPSFIHSASRLGAGSGLMVSPRHWWARGRIRSLPCYSPAAGDRQSD